MGATCPQALSKNDRMATVRDQANKEARKGSDKSITRYARFEKIDAAADDQQLDEQLAKVRVAIGPPSGWHRRVVRWSQAGLLLWWHHCCCRAGG